jgi:hypothetical protein
VSGNYIEDGDEGDFGGHDSTIQIGSDGTIKYTDLTVPYGVVNESSEISWLPVLEASQVIHDYLCCTCILWTGRYPQVQRVIDEGNNQSMEVNIFDGYDDADDGLFHVTDAEFSALTILGQNVEPCFESSTIEAYTLNKFKREFSLMLRDIKAIATDSKKTKNSSISGEKANTVPNIESKLNANTSSFKKEEKKIMKKKEIAAKFALTMEQLENELGRVISAEVFICEDWCGDPCECRKYYLEDYDQAFVYVHDCEQSIDVKLPYALTGDDIGIDITKASRIKFSPVDWVGETDPADVADTTQDSMGDMAMALKEEYTKKFGEKTDAKVKEAEKAKEVEFAKTLKAEKVTLNAGFAKTLEAEKVTLNAEFAKTLETEKGTLNAESVKVSEAEKATLSAEFGVKITDLTTASVEKDTKISELEKSVKEFTVKCEDANKKVEELNEYKLTKDGEEKEAKFAEYSEELTEEEMKSVKDKIAEYSVETIENKLALAFAKKTHKVNKNVLPAHNTMDIETYGLKENSEEVKSVWDRLPKNSL